MAADLQRRIGFWGASAVMVGVIIGSGIFRQPPEIARHLGSPWVILAFWLAGGVLSLFGALTYSELACMYPQSGGVYVFIREGLGLPVAFVFGWTYMLITKPFAAAGIAVMFSENLSQLCGTSLNLKVTTTVLLIGLTVINTLGVNVGAGFAKWLTGAKMLALLAIVVLAVVLGKGGSGNFAATESSGSVLAAFAPVMAAIMWTYDGWSDVGAIAGEVENPQKLMPRIFVAGTLAVTGLYLAVNAAYMWLMPLAEMRGTNNVAPVVMGRLIGPVGATAVVVIIMVSTLGSTHSSVLTGARVTFAQARDGLLFRPLARVHPRFKTPAVALWVQLALSCAAVWYQSDKDQPAKLFSRLADGFVFTMWIFYGLAAVAVFTLRVKRPDVERPYRCWGYPVVPAVFVLAALAMTVLSIRFDLNDPASKGMATLPWLGVLAAGIPVYWIWKALAGRGEVK